MSIEIFIRNGSIDRVRINPYNTLDKSISISGLHVIVMEHRRFTIDSGDGTYYNWVIVPLSTLTPTMIADYTTSVQVIRRALALIGCFNFSSYLGECR
jgi:hypothetical protein